MRSATAGTPLCSTTTSGIPTMTRMSSTWEINWWPGSSARGIGWTGRFCRDNKEEMHDERRPFVHFFLFSCGDVDDFLNIIDDSGIIIFLATTLDIMASREYNKLEWISKA